MPYYFFCLRNPNQKLCLQDIVPVKIKSAVILSHSPLCYFLCRNLFFVPLCLFVSCLFVGMSSNCACFYNYKLSTRLHLYSALACLYHSTTLAYLHLCLFPFLLCLFPFLLCVFPFLLCLFPFLLCLFLFLLCLFSFLLFVLNYFVPTVMRSSQGTS